MNFTCNDDTSSLWEDMRDAEVAYHAHPTAENQEELARCREVWLFSMDGVRHFQAHGCHSVTRFLGDTVMWRDWTSSDIDELREHCAAVSRDLISLLYLARDPVPQVKRQAHATLTELLGEGWWEQMKPDPTWQQE